MIDKADLLTTLALLFLLGFLADVVSRRFPVPRVTVLLIFGAWFGPFGSREFTETDMEWIRLLADITPALVVFLTGSRLTTAVLQEYSRLLFWVSTTIVTSVFVMVWAGLTWMGVASPTAILLAAIATATAPAVIIDVVFDHRADGPFTRILMGVLATNITLALMLFSVILPLVHSMIVTHDSLPHDLGMAAWQMAGAVVVGIVSGTTLNHLLARIRRRDATFVLTLGILFLCSGCATILHVSTLLSALAMGITTNRSRYSPLAFHAARSVLWPFLIFLFIFAGATISPSALLDIGWIGVALFVLRLAGMLLGGWIGMNVCEEADAVRRRWLGPALLPQGSVTFGLTLTAIQELPTLAPILLPIVISSVVLSEIIGPSSTRLALIRSGETNVRQN
jgi:Kef-type K+ transport system membrane component KefB